MVLNSVAAKLRSLGCFPMKLSNRSQYQTDIDIDDDDVIYKGMWLSKSESVCTSKPSQRPRRSRATSRSRSSDVTVKSSSELHAPARRAVSCGVGSANYTSTPRLTEVLSFQEDNFPMARVDFVRYTRARSCEENALYLMEFEKLSILKKRTRGLEKFHELVLSTAIKLVDDYISDHSLHPLNISNTRRTQAVRFSLDRDIENLFLSLRSIAEEIREILELGVWDKFVEWRCSQ